MYIYILVTIALLSYYAYNCFRILCPERGDKGRDTASTLYSNEKKERGEGREGGKEEREG